MVLPLLIVSILSAPVLIGPEADLSSALIVDARSSSAYDEGHLTRAKNKPPPHRSGNKGGVMGLLRPVDEVRGMLAERGVDPERHVVVYASAANVGDLTNATRLFWILEYLGYPEVSLLDGGIDAWMVAGQPVSTETSTAAPVSIERVTLPLRDDRKVDADDIVEIIEDGGATLTDTRSPEQYAGASKSPAAKKAGHIPGAANVPASGLLDSVTFRFKPIEALAELSKTAGTDGEERRVTYCNTGRSATMGYVLYRALGFDSVSVYDGSMSEWTGREDAQVEAETP